jgi:hypothetical protein
MRRFHTDIHRAQCCLELVETWEYVRVNNFFFFHFALKRYFVSKTLRYFWLILYKEMYKNFFR